VHWTGGLILSRQLLKTKGRLATFVYIVYELLHRSLTVSHFLLETNMKTGILHSTIKD